MNNPGEYLLGMAMQLLNRTRNYLIAEKNVAALELFEPDYQALTKKLSVTYNIPAEDE